jgi:hypothetical protein
LLFRNKISYILDVPNTLHERIIIKNESSLEYKEMIFVKFLIHYHWVGTIYLHVIEIKKDNMVIDISHKVTLG